MSVRVVKVGGSALADASWLAELAVQVARSAEPVVVVHGGGPDISRLSERLGLKFDWVDGRRATSPELMDIVSMVLTGRVNKRIVRALIGAGADAIGLSGEDGGLLEADFAEGGMLGRVGRVRRVRRDLLEVLVSRGMVPVISPVSRGPDGNAVNVNADEAADAVAVALESPELMFVTDVAGVLEHGEVRTELSVAAARALIEAGHATGGMVLKLSAALNALDLGVPMVRIGPSGMLLDPKAGTRMRQEQVAACP